MPATSRPRRILGPLAGLAILGLTFGVAGMAAGSGATHASAQILAVDPTDATRLVAIGWARFTEDASGRLHVNVKVEGLTSGLHGIHIHRRALCEGPAFLSAESHHNPDGVSLHGLGDDVVGAHAGDLPNMVVNVAGRGRLNAVSDRATISPGTLSVFDSNGSAIVIHALEDDQRADTATGNSGSRVACGVIIAD